MLTALLSSYQATGDTEPGDVERMRRLAASSPDPWSRSLPLHFTASALVVHAATRRVLLRWHVKLGLWLQVGGHADPGERDPLTVALREAREETGLTDLSPWPDGRLRHAAVCRVPAAGREPRHEHADLRYVLATEHPDAIAPEDERSPLRWLTLDQARELVGGNNLRHTLDRTELLFHGGSLARVASARAVSRWGRVVPRWPAASEVELPYAPDRVRARARAPRAGR